MKSLMTLSGAVVCLILATVTPVTSAGQDATMKFSDATNTAPTPVEVQVQIQNPDGTWGTIYIGPILIPANAPATLKRDLIKAALQQVFGNQNVTDVGSNGLNLHVDTIDNRAMRVKFLPGATGENPDSVSAATTTSGAAAFANVFAPTDYHGQPAIFTAGIVTDVGELSVQVSAQELNFQTDGPIICQALFQRLAPHAPQYGAQINYAGDRLEVYFDPAYTVIQGGVIFGTTSTSPGCSGEIQIPAGSLPGDMNCDGVVDFGDINPFILALTDPAGYAAAYPNCPLSNGDINGDGRVDFGDINPFIGLLIG